MLPTLALGAAGIALLGASLIPLGYALKMLSEVKYDNIKGMGTTLSDLAFEAVKIAPLAPLLGIASLAMSAFVLSSVPFTNSLETITGTIGTIDPTNLTNLITSLTGISSVSVTDMLAVSASLGALALSVAAFKTIGFFGDMFKSDGAEKIASSLSVIETKIGAVDMLDSALLRVNSTLLEIGKTMEGLDFSEISIPTNPEVTTIQTETPKNAPSVNQNLKTVAYPTTVPKPPRKEASAQNYDVSKIVEKNIVQKTERFDRMQEEVEATSDSVYDFSTKKIESLLQQLITVMSNKTSETGTVNIDGYQLNNVIKKYNNR
jgi:hypothetical protein